MGTTRCGLTGDSSPGVEGCQILERGKLPTKANSGRLGLQLLSLDVHLCSLRVHLY